MTDFHEEVPFSVKFHKAVRDYAKRPLADRLQIHVDMGAMTPAQREAAIQRDAKARARKRKARAVKRGTVRKSTKVALGK